MQNRSFQDVFKELRMEKKLSQDKLAEELDISSSLISKWENNQSTPAPEMLEYIATYFGVSTDYLIGKTKYKNLENILQETLKNNSSIQQIYKDEDGYSFEYYNEDGIPFCELSREEQEKILQNAMDSLYEIKRNLKDKK